MTIRSRTTQSIAGGGMGVAQSRCGAASRAICLGLAGLLVAVSLVGCWWDSPTAEPTARDAHTATLLPTAAC